MPERRRLLLFGLVFFALLAVIAYSHLALSVGVASGGPTQLYPIDSLF